MLPANLVPISSWKWRHGDLRARGDTSMVKSSQVNTLPIAKSQTRSKQNKGMQKYSRVYSERGVLLPV